VGLKERIVKRLRYRGVRAREQKGLERRRKKCGCLEREGKIETIRRTGKKHMSGGGGNRMEGNYRKGCDRVIIDDGERSKERNSFGANKQASSRGEGSILAETNKTTLERKGENNSEVTQKTVGQGGRNTYTNWTQKWLR